MAFDENLAARKKGVVEKKMFGGVVFMLHGDEQLKEWIQRAVKLVGKLPGR